ncbi:MAG: P83/100 family protein, partial [Spirochaetaceae bacterium]
MMRKTGFFSLGLFVLLLFAFAALPGGFAQELAEEEIRGVTGGDISFTNYEGPYDKIETDEEIRSIGRILSSRIDAAEEQRAAFFDKYSIVRIAPRVDAEGYGADIFRINREARVDHIDNVRRMISGYVQNVFGYSRDEADVIAVFLTFYNAVHRGDMEYFEENYHEGVTDQIDPEKAGIATRYTDWPGNTELLIPLRTVGEETALSTDTVGEDEIIERIREDEEDRGVEERKEMVEIRERELEEEEEETERAREELEEREREIEERDEETEGTQEEEEEEQEEEAEREGEQEEVEEERERIEEEEEEQQERRESIQEER